jgi:hypothetical protein
MGITPLFSVAPLLDAELLIFISKIMNPNGCKKMRWVAQRAWLINLNGSAV